MYLNIIYIKKTNFIIMYANIIILYNVYINIEYK